MDADVCEIPTDFRSVSRTAYLPVLLGDSILRGVKYLGDLAAFTWTALQSLTTTFPRWRHIVEQMYSLGFLSLPVVLITGAFTGMVLAVQSYSQAVAMQAEALIGAVVSLSMVRELGPVLTALMLTSRVGGGMVAELGGMRVTEQIDAMETLGADPVRYLVTPRIVAAVLMTPVLTVFSDLIGILGGWVVTVGVYNQNSYYYWQFVREWVSVWDAANGLIKSFFFGGVIALVCSHRGFTASGGAMGVGRAATRATVLASITVLVSDFFLTVLLTDILGIT